MPRSSVPCSGSEKGRIQIGAADYSVLRTVRLFAFSILSVIETETYSLFIRAMFSKEISSGLTFVSIFRTCQKSDFVSPLGLILVA